MKTIFYMLSLITTIAILTSCASVTKLELPEPEVKHYSVGDTAHGGIIFLVNSQGTHGLVAALQDQLVNSHYNDSYDLVNDPRYHDEFGKVYFDWRLPKLWEAYKMYMNLHMVNLGNFANSGYWTSETTLSFDKMRVLNFSKGIDHESEKSDTYRARGVRIF